MLKRIPTEKLKLGMYIHELAGSWMDHPFWKNAFLLDDPKDLKTILSTQLKSVWIDTAKGIDIDDGDTEEVVAAKVDASLARANMPVYKTQHINTAEEVSQASIICSKSKEAVSSMFREARMGNALNANDALPIVEEISLSVMRNPGALISLARLKKKDDYTYMHSVAVCALMVSLSRQLGLNDDQTRKAGLAGLLHDIGKMMISPAILNKPGKLTDEEFAAMKSHPAEGHKILLQGSDICDEALDVCLHHHEKIDGSGYPNQLSNDQISLYAKMGAVCDVYDAITSERPYKKGWEPAESLRKMAEWSKGHYDQRIFEAFVRSVGIYPVGSLVKLKSNRLAVIIEQSEKSLLTPIVTVFFSISLDARIPLETLDLSKPGCTDRITSHENPVKWKIHDILELWSGMTHLDW